MKKAFIIHMISCLILTIGLAWGIIEGVDYTVNHDQVNWLFLAPAIAGLIVATLHILTSPMSKFKRF